MRLNSIINLNFYTFFNNRNSIKENREDTAYIDLKITTTYVFEGLYENFQMMQQLSLLLQWKYDHHVICVLLSMSSTFVYLMSVG